MMLADLLDARSVELGFEKRRKQKVIERLVDLATAAHPVGDTGRLVREILQRDNEVSTAVGDGVAIPHKLTSLVQSPVMAFAQLKKPGNFSIPDGIPVRLCFLLLAPEGAVNEHLRTLSKLARILHNATFRGALLEVTEAGDVIELIRKHEQ